MKELAVTGLIALALLLAAHAPIAAGQEDGAGAASSGDQPAQQAGPGAIAAEGGEQDDSQPEAEPTASADQPAEPPLPSPQPAEPDEASFEILGKRLEPGELRQFNWQLDTAMAGLAVPTPVLVAHGREPGMTLCLVAAVHGDELNGVEIVRRIMFNLDLDSLIGNVVGIPIANAFGFLRSSRYLPDRRDLNRYFPGTPNGSMASRFAHALFSRLISRCDVLVDIHTGSFHRTNLPQLRADLTIGPVLNLTKQFGDIAVLHNYGPAGSLRRAATDIGIAAVTLETGGPARFQKDAVEAGAEAIEALLNHLGMVKRTRRFGDPLPVFYESTWVRVEAGGILMADVELGAMVEEGERLGTVTDPIQNQRTYLEAPFRGRILGMAANQVVMPGFAAFHIGRAADEQQAIESSAAEDDQDPAADAADDSAPSAEDELFNTTVESNDEPDPEPQEGRHAPTWADGAGWFANGRPAGASVMAVPRNGQPGDSSDSGKALKPPTATVDAPGMESANEARCVRPPWRRCPQTKDAE